MKMWKNFECPSCREVFEYEMSSLSTARLEEIELRIGRACRIMIDCPHCPKPLLVDRETGLAAALDDRFVAQTDDAGFMYDMTFREALEDRVKALLAQGHDLMATDPASAEARFNEALSIQKREPLAWYNIGVCRLMAGDFGRAEDCFRRALQLDAKLLQAWNNLGAMLLSLDRIDEAESCFVEGIKVDSSYAKFYLGQANVNLVRGNNAAARGFLLEALKVDPNYAPARKGLAMLSTADGQLS